MHREAKMREPIPMNWLASLSSLHGGQGTGSIGPPGRGPSLAPSRVILRRRYHQEAHVFLRTKEPREGKREEPLPEPNEGLPDSYRPSGLCPRCGKQSSFEVAGSLPVTFDSSYLYDGERYEASLIDRVSSLICRHCKQGVVVIEEEWVGEAPKKRQKSGGVISHRGIHWWPLPETNLSADIPRPIVDVFGEAAMALAANCPRAAAVMARRTLEAVTVERGEDKGTLAERLKSLGTRGVLLPTLSDWAKEVRLIGNVGAHFDPIETVSRYDAQQLLSFVRELLRFLYELPAELARRRTPKVEPGP